MKSYWIYENKLERRRQQSGATSADQRKQTATTSCGVLRLQTAMYSGDEQLRKMATIGGIPR